MWRTWKGLKYIKSSNEPAHATPNRHQPSSTMGTPQQAFRIRHNSSAQLCSHLHQFLAPHRQSARQPSHGSTLQTTKYEMQSLPLPLTRQQAQMDSHFDVYAPPTTAYQHSFTSSTRRHSPMSTIHGAGGKPRVRFSPNPTNQITSRPRPIVSLPFSIA